MKRRLRLCGGDPLSRKRQKQFYLLWNVPKTMSFASSSLKS